MKKYIIISLFAAAGFNSNAQDLLNTENNFYTKENFSGSFNLGIDYNSGNVDTNNLDFSSNINYKYTDNIIKFYGNKKYGKTNNIKSVDNETVF